MARRLGKQFVLGLLVFAGAVGLGAAGYWQIRAQVERILPDPSLLQRFYPLVEYRGPDNPFLIKFHMNRPAAWVSLDSVSTAAIGAVVVSEDWAFFDHPGYDWKQIQEAMRVDFERQKFARGASTITQQVAKNLFLSHEKSLVRKIKEVLIAMRMEKYLGKKRILEIYLNIAEWGDGIFGIGQASEFYFQKPPSQLTAKEGAFLAILLPSPKRYAHSFRQQKLTAFAERSIARVLRYMAMAKYISKPERDLAMRKRLSFETVEMEGEAEGELVDVVGPVN